MISSEAEARDFVGQLCSERAMDQLDRLIAALTEENEQQNLVARRSLDIAWQRHIGDSAQLLRFVPHGTSSIIDLGSGAGFPGVVLAIMRPDIEVVLIESRAKRVEWLTRLVDDFALANCVVAGSRVQNVGERTVDVITARAFAPLKTLLSLSARFSTSHTLYVLPKGRSAAQELSELSQEAKKLFHVEQSLTDDDAGIIVGRINREVAAAL